jgi:hypothetical protein
LVFSLMGFETEKQTAVQGIKKEKQCLKKGIVHIEEEKEE